MSTISSFSEIYYRTPGIDEIAPQLFTCVIPFAYINKVPSTISLQIGLGCLSIEKNPSNMLKVLNFEKDVSSKKKLSIGVCVQALRFFNYEYSVRMVEWLEMVKMLGADKVYFYNLEITKSMKKVLKHFEKKVMFNILLM